MQTLRMKPVRLPGNQKGLTLVELLAVIIVLGIIMAIAVPSIMGVINRSKIQADKGSWYVIQEAGLRYALANNVNSSTVVTVADLASSGYLNAVPTKQSNKVTGFGSVRITINANGQYEVDVFQSNDGTGTAISAGTFDS